MADRDPSASQRRSRGPSFSVSGLTPPHIAALRARWQKEGRWSVEQILVAEPRWRDKPDMILDLVYLETELRRSAGDAPTVAEYLSRFPTIGDKILDLFAIDDFVETPHHQQDSANDETQDFGGNSLEGLVPHSDGDQTSPDPLGNPSGNAQITHTNLRLPAIDGYEILGEIARGGMGVVFKAKQIKLNRIVAVKVILPGQLASPDAIDRFYTEAQAAACLDHPGIVPIFEVDEAHGVHYFSMGYIEGQNLADLVAKGPMPQREAARLVEAISEAVQYAHDRKIIHRDLKPRNILLTSTGEPKVSDFGLAKQIEADHELTASGQIMGTPSYMPPEQALGKLDLVGPRSDVYSIGAILYTLLTGRPPFQATSFVDTLRDVIETPPIAPRVLNRRVDRDLETICLKCLEKLPEHRYPTAKEVAAELRRYQDGEPIRARRLGMMGRSWRWARRHPQFVGATLAIVLLAVIASFAGVAIWRSERDRVVTNSHRDVDSMLNNLNAEVESFHKLESAIAKHEKLDAEAAALFRVRAVDAYAAAIRKSLLSSRINEQGFVELERANQIIGDKNSDLASQLQGDITARKESWQTVFEAFAPFKASISKQLTAVSPAADGSFIEQAKVQGLSERPTLQLMAGDAAEIQATFDASWRLQNRIGVSLWDAKGYGYEFLLVAERPPEEESPPASTQANESPWTFEDAQGSGASYAIEIRRNGIPLVRRHLEPAALKEPPVALRGTRNGDQLSLQINGLAPLQFEDPFPLDGKYETRFALVPSPGAKIVQINARERMRATAVSKLREGDDLFSRGKFQEALDSYLLQTAETSEVSEELDFKIGMCHLALNQFAEAEERFAKVFENGSSRWCPTAGCRLWQARMRQGRMDEAYHAFEQLESKYSESGVGAVASLDLRDEVRKLSIKSNEGFRLANLLQYRPKRLEESRRIAAIDRFFSSDGLGDPEIQTNVARELAMAGDISGAMAAAQPIGAHGASGLAVRHYVRLLRLNKQYTHARAEIDHYNATRPGYAAPLQWELARCYAAEGEWAKCESVIDGLYLTIDEETLELESYSTIALMKGFLLDRRGAKAAALRTWRDGFQRSTAIHRDDHHRVSAFLNELVLRSLCDQVDDEFTKRFMANVFGAAGNSPLLRQAESLVDGATMSQVLRRMWRSKLGRRLAEDFAFERGTLRDRIVVPMALAATEYANLTAYSSEMTDDEYALVFEHGLATAEKLIFAGELNVAQIAGLVVAWKGSTGTLGWTGVSPTLPPESRRFLTYLMAHRWHSRGDTAAAIKVLTEQFPGDNSDDSLARAARKDLDRLKGQRGTLVFDRPRDAIAKVRVTPEIGEPFDIDLATTSEIDVATGKFTLRLDDASEQGILSVTEGAIQTMRKVVVNYQPKVLPNSSLAVQPLVGIVAAPRSSAEIDRWQLVYRRPHLAIGRSLIAVSPDESQFATTSGDHVVRIFDSTNGRLAAVLSATFGSFNDLQWSADGGWLAAAGGSNQINLWRTSDGKRVQAISTSAMPQRILLNPFETQKGDAFALAGISSIGLVGYELSGRTFSTVPTTPDSYSLAVAATAAGPPTGFLSHRNATSTSIPKRLAVISSNLSARYLLLGYSQVHAAPKLLDDWNYDSGNYAIGFSHDGKYLAATTATGKLRIWRTDDWGHLEDVEIPSLNHTTHLQWSNDSSLIGIARGHRVFVVDNPLKDNGSPVGGQPAIRQIDAYGLSGAASINGGKSLLAVGELGEFQRVDLVDGKITRISEPRYSVIEKIAARPVPLDPREDSVASSVEYAVLDNQGTVRLMDARGAVQHTVQRTISGGMPRMLCWRSDGERFVVGYWSTGAQIVRADGTTISQLPIDLYDANPAMVWSPDGHELLAIDSSRRFQRFDDEGRPLGQLSVNVAEFGNITTMDSHPSGRLAIGFDKPIVAVMTPQGEVMKTIQLPPDRGAVSMCKFSPDGKDILIAQFGERCGIWSIDGTEITKTITTEASGNAQAKQAWLADGSGVLSIDWYPYRAYFHGRNGRLLKEIDLSHVPSPVQQIVPLSKGGQWLATDLMGTLRRFDADGGLATQTVQIAPNGKVVTLSPSGQISFGSAADLDDDFVIAAENDDQTLRIINPSEFLHKSEVKNAVNP